MTAPGEDALNSNPSAFGHPLATGETLAIRFSEPPDGIGVRRTSGLPLSASATVEGATPDSVVVRLASPFTVDGAAGRRAKAVIVRGSSSLIAQVRTLPIVVADERLLELRLVSRWHAEDRRGSLRIRCSTRARVAPDNAEPETATFSQALDISHSGIALACTAGMAERFTQGGPALCWLEFAGVTVELRCTVASVEPDRIGLVFDHPDARAQRIIGTYLFRLQVHERGREVAE